MGQRVMRRKSQERRVEAKGVGATVPSLAPALPRREPATAPSLDPAARLQRARRLGHRCPALGREGVISPGARWVQAYRKKDYVPDLDDLKVPKSKSDKATYSEQSFSRPSGWYDNTYEALLERANKKVVDDPFHIGRKVMLIQCGNTGQPCTADAMDIGHKVDWATYLARVGPETVREAINAYNDLANLQLESASANRSHDWERSQSGKFRDLPEKGSKGSKTRKVHDKLMESYGGLDLDEYDLDDPMIDIDEEESATLVDMKPLTCTSRSGLAVNRWETFSGGAFIALTGNVEQGGKYLEFKVVSSYDSRLHDDTVAWASKKHLIKVGDVQAY